MQDAVEKCLRFRTKAVKLGFIDDEALYRKSFQEIFNSMKPLNSLVELHMFSESKAVVDQFVKRDGLDVIICDIDLGESSINGFQLVGRLRDLGYKNPVCIHTNRLASAESGNLLSSDGDVYIPKPLKKGDLIRFLYKSLVEVGNNDVFPVNAPNTSQPQPIS
ncbi:MAG: response regulator [Oligoflexales bacterium]|nr:response regulator [Oligoflexales bacterium]